MTVGPQTPLGQWVFKNKYASEGETFKEAMARVASALKDDDAHFLSLKNILYNQRFMPGGRVQSAMGAPRQVTPYNCFVLDTIPDSMDGIMRIAAESAETMRLGGGVGYDFSTLRPSGARIASIDSTSSGPLAFMDVFDSLCKCILAAGHRRGAQMGVLRVDHPDIEKFISAKNNHESLRNFNISVGITKEFMDCLDSGTPFDLKFDGRVYKTVDAASLWEKILRCTWDWADPGVLFIDRINKKNNLWYCETIAATNPCGEQPLPPNGACLLGSFNLTKYLMNRGYEFNWDQFIADIPHVVRAMDNVPDRAVFPLEAQKLEAQSKRRMGLGITGLANTLEVMGKPYGSQEALDWVGTFMNIFANQLYSVSSDLAKEKGSFPLYDSEKFLESDFIKRLSSEVRSKIKDQGIRNSHLISIAPTGTISLTADNISSGIEPVFSLRSKRDVHTEDGMQTWDVVDYALAKYGVEGVTSDQLTPKQHVDILNTCSYWVDSACSKTVNIGEDVTWDEFKSVYQEAYDGGASGCTTFRAAGKRFGMMRPADEEPEEPPVPEGVLLEDGTACYIDPETGIKTCE